MNVQCNQYAIDLGEKQINEGSRIRHPERDFSMCEKLVFNIDVSLISKQRMGQLIYVAGKTDNPYVII